MQVILHKVPITTVVGSRLNDESYIYIQVQISEICICYLVFCLFVCLFVCLEKGSLQIMIKDFEIILDYLGGP